MKMYNCVCAALLAATAGAASGDASITVYGRAGMPVGSDRHAYIVDTARPASFDAQRQAEVGPGRAGGPAVQALANARPAPSGVAGREDAVHTVAYGRAGYVPDFLTAGARNAQARRIAGANAGASAQRTE